MAYRSFRDADGTEWEAWDVIPRLVERRLGQRRAQRQSGDAVDRRHGMERRMLLRRRAAAELEHGWLCFERGEEKRRLAPIPEDWPRCDDARLAQYCREAQPVRRPGPDFERPDAAPAQVPAAISAPLLALELPSTPAPPVKGA